MWLFTVASLEHEPLRDLGVGQPVGHEPEHLDLARGEPVGARRHGPPRRLDRCRDEVVGDRRVDGRAVVEHLPQRLVDLGTAGVLGEVAARTGPQRVEDRAVVGVGGEDDDAHVGVLGAQPAGGLDAVAARHAQVHQHDVGRQLAGERDGLGAVGGGADDLDAGQQAEHHGQALADHPLVVGDEHPDHAGTARSTRNPSWSAVVTSVPPSSSARSRMPVSP